MPPDEPYAAAGASLPFTEALADRVLVLPTGTAIIDRDIEIIGLVVEHAAAICGRSSV